MNYLVLAAVCVGSAVARPDGAGGHHGHHATAAAAAPTSYEPAPSYSAPATGYEQPSAGYGAPSGYEQPSYESGYGASGYSSGYGVAAEDNGGIDLTLLLIPILIIAGLALLFPTTTTVPVTGPGRRRRDVDDEVSGNSLVERVQDIYMSVIQSEECMERVACELGGIVADTGMPRNVFNVAGAFVPTKYSKMMKTFATGKDCHKIKCGSLF